MRIKTEKLKIKADHIGIASSFLCLIHCLALPLIASAYIITDNFHSEESDHIHHHHSGFNWDYVFAALAVVAAIFVIRKTPHPWIRVFLSIGALFFAIGVLLHDSGSLYYLMHTGSTILIITHTVNLIMHRGQCTIQHKH